MAFRSVLCVIHSGAANDEAVAQAALLASPQTELSFLAVAGGAHGGGEESAAENGSVRLSLDKAAALAAERGVSASVRTVRGANPSRLLLDASTGADLLVVGGRDDPRPGDVVLGSTASSAVHAAELPVLVARRPPEGRNFPRDILVATDGSPDSQRGVELAGRVAGAHESRIALVHISDGRTQSHRTLGEDAVALTQEVGIEAATIEEFGNPAEQIADVARRERVSLLVVGSRGLGGARILGSVGERLAHEAPCSVLVARPG
jgi:nucleotide-binding universal stress UspA family protein